MDCLTRVAIVSRMQVGRIAICVKPDRKKQGLRFSTVALNASGLQAFCHESEMCYLKRDCVNR